jgi:uncharacterized protein
MSELSNSRPIEKAERIFALDVLRGFAVLGILIINIQSFSMIQAAYLNPSAFGDLSGNNLWVWILSHVFADQKFMTLFSIMFGAGIILLTQRLESRNLKSAGLYYRRILGLFIIGILHAYLLWYGDILVVYALCGILIYLFRKLSAKRLVILGLLSLSACSLLYLFFGWSLQFWPQEAYQNMLTFWKPAIDEVNREIAQYQGGWLDQMEHRVPASLSFQTFVFLIWAGWRAGGLMLIGMALYKWGIIIAHRTTKFYITGLLIGIIVGIPLVVWGVISNFKADWSLNYSMYFGCQFNYWGSIFVSFAYICLIMLICKAQRFKFALTPFATAGRMALTNYLLQTIICTTIFYGHGFGLFGNVSRTGQIGMVFIIFIFQLIISPIWLKYFRFGPFEWLWRSFTYLKFQPLRQN